MAKWPSELIIVRHGQSVANALKQAGLPKDPAMRDMDYPLTEMGWRQSLELGKRLRESYRTPHTIVTSPYVRAKETVEGIVDGMGFKPEIVIEERVREIDFGIFDGLSYDERLAKYPDEVARWDRLGKYWYRPPGGESRPDVRLRVHSFLGTLTRDYVDEKVLVVCHSVVVLAFRSLLERWEEEQYMKIDQEDDVRNAAATIYQRDNDRLELQQYNW